jgi:RHS repeat-associated protein
VARVLYYPYGEERYVEGTLTTDYGFTGQRKNCYLDTYSMGAREYDPGLGRWLSADTIVPDPANPQSLNRYSYVYNNSLKYTDPTGHLTETELRDILGDYYDKLMEIWQDDPYWLAVLDGLESGDYLYASELEGGLLFQEVDGVMRTFAYGGASSNLWDWQGKGYYTIDKPLRDSRADEAYSDELFTGIASEYSNAVIAMYDQPLYEYSFNSPSGALSVEYSGYLVMNRYTEVNWTGAINILTGDKVGAGIDFAADGVLTIGGAISPAKWLVVVGLAKFALDAGATGVKTFAAPVYYYDVTPIAPGQYAPVLTRPWYCLGFW